MTATVHQLDDRVRRDLREAKLSAGRAYLACVFHDSRILDQHVPNLDALGDVKLRHVLEAALAMHGRNEAVDTVTMRAALIARHGKVDDDFLLSLTNIEASPGNARRYVEIINDDHRTRLVREAVAKRSEALRAGDPAAPAALASDLEGILARELDEGPLAGGAWVHEIGEDAIGETPPPRRWLLQLAAGDRYTPWLARGKAGMLASAGGVGKTFLAIQLALAVATGKRWLGCLWPPEPGCVALILAEEDRDEVMRRLHYAAIEMRLTREERELAAQRIWIQPRAGKRSAVLETDAERNLRETEFMRSLRRYMRGSGREWALVILDPVARLAPPEAEKDNQIATQTVEVIESLVQLPGSPTVLVLHHTNKNARSGERLTASSSRGVTAFNDGFRWSAQLGPAFSRPSGGKKGKRVDGFWALSVGKSNYNAASSIILTRDAHANGVMRLATEEEHDEHSFDLRGDA